MHFKNGRPAKEGDQVVTRNYNGKIVTGTIYNLREGETCNCDVAVVIPGGTQQLTCQTVGYMYHAEDAYAAIEPKVIASEPQAEAAAVPKTE